MRSFLLFLAVNLALLFIIFNRAIWGDSLLAPLDLGPTLFSKYRFVDPQANDIPANHYISDGFVYDLPLQYRIYESLHGGEMPWWDPYGCTGKPLLADSHINGLDPFRLLFYELLPFKLAFNYTLITHTFLCGVGLFLLLTYLGFNFEISLWLALAYEFSGAFALHFCHPWIQASFLYYPFLWISWCERMRTGKAVWLLLSSLLIAAIFYAGNLQSHAYFILFSGAFLAGYLKWPLKKNGALFFSVVSSVVIGFLLAAPILLSTLEDFFLSLRSGEGEFRHPLLAFLFSFSAFYPWTLGTFRTLDLAKLTNDAGLGFKLYFGSASFFLALLGCCLIFLKKIEPPIRSHLKTSLYLFAGYFFLVGTPLFNILYTRLAGLAVLGACILAAEALQCLLHEKQIYKKLGLLLFYGSLLLVIFLNFFAFLIYPQIKQKVRQSVEARDASLQTQALRHFQVENLPNEISVLNPETWIALLSLILLSLLFLKPEIRSKKWFLHFLLISNLLPVLLFFHLYIPNHDIALWQRLKSGGQEQRSVVELLNPEHQRFVEHESDSYAWLFPGALQALYKVHTVNGHTSFWPKSLGRLSPQDLAVIPLEATADYLYESDYENLSTGSLKKITASTQSRFFWEEQNLDRSIQIVEETQNTLRLKIGAGPSGQLVRTDTYFPGWTLFVNGKETALISKKPCFSVLNVPKGEASVLLVYQPRFLKWGVIATLVGFILLVVLCLPKHKKIEVLV